MITRYWRGWTGTAEDGDAYEHLLRTRILPGLRSVPGHRGATVLRRTVENGVEFVVLTRFESLEAVGEFAGPDYDVPVIEPEARRLLARIEERAIHYETVIELV